MYRIEVAPGEETVFRTIEELAVGIRNGVVTPRARIYHHASQKWLPISLHPHYKRALEMPGAKAAQPSAKGLTPRLSPRAEPRSVAPTPEPKPVSRPDPRPVLRPAPIQQPTSPAEPARMVPAPVPSPIVAMQQEVLRDLPVVTIPEPFAATPTPEPLPWSPPAPRVAAPPPPRPTVQAHPTVTAGRTRFADPVDERVVRWGMEQPHADPALEQRRAAPAIEQRHAVPAVESQHGRMAPEPQHARLEEAAPPRPTARRSPRMNGRPMLLVGVAAGLVIGTHLALTATPSPNRAEPTIPADVRDEPRASQAAEQPVSRPAAEQPVSPQPEQPEPVEPPRVTTDPARVPMTPGPAFAGSAPARPGVSRSEVPSTRTRAAAPQAAPPAALGASGDAGPSPAPAIAPPPAEVELTLPDLAADSIVPKARTGDTLAMKKILRALNGTKP